MESKKLIAIDMKMTYINENGDDESYIIRVIEEDASENSIADAFKGALDEALKFQTDSFKLNSIVLWNILE